MATLFAQGSSTLYKVNLSSGALTTLTLPTGVTLATSRKARFATLNQWVVMINSPSRNLAIDPEGTVRVLVPEPPTHGPDPATSGTGLTGDYRYKISFYVKDTDGNIIMESPLSDYYETITLANQGVALADIAISADNITGRRVYRTLAGGETYYHLTDVEDNTTTSILDTVADNSLSLLPTLATTLAAPPGTVPGIRLKQIVEWKSRLWAVADHPDYQDTIYFTDTNKIYAWGNSVIVHPTGQDALGIVGFAPRRSQLGIIKRNGVWIISGTAASTGIAASQIQVSQIESGRAGSLSPDTIVVANDKVFWLGNDGVYEWSDNGVVNITDEAVAPWFQTDTYFNRTRFPQAFAKWNELRRSYDLHLANAGDSSENRWVSFNTINRKWYGPHVTAAFTPNHATQLIDENGLPLCFVGGSDGVIYQANSANIRDGAATAIDFDIYGPFHHAGNPDATHYWGELGLFSDIEAAGTLTVTPYLGGLDASAGTAISHTLTTGRERLRRLGTGRLCRLRMRQNSVNQACAIHGYDVDPVHELGSR